MKKIFHTFLMSKIHKDFGRCERQDFGTLKLFQLEEDEKELIVSFETYNAKEELILFKGEVYRKLNKETRLGIDQDKTKFFLSRQGKFTQDLAINLMMIISQQINNYSIVTNEIFILIGRTLYKRYCKLEDLGIGVTGNMMFAHWISISIEPNNHNKELYPLNKKEFQKVVRKEFARWKKGDPKTTNIYGDTHSHFSKPTKVRWGKNFLE